MFDKAILDPVSSDSLLLFAKEKGLDRKCDECGENSWYATTEEPDNGGKTAAIINALPQANWDRFVPCYALFCNNCGVMKMIYAGAVRKWEDSRG